MTKIKLSEDLASKVTQAELKALGNPLGPLVNGGVDRYFKWRHAFIALTGAFFLARLMFAPDVALPLVSLYEVLGVDTTQYVQFRALYVAVGLLVYVVSYTRDWYYPQVALIVFALGLQGLITDMMNYFAFYQDWPPVFVVLSLTTRLAIVVCLFYNAIRAHRAPPMPRHLWS